MTDIYASTDTRLIELIGSKIRSLRLNRNQSQTSLAADSGVAVSVVQRLENGSGCTLLNIVKILRGLQQLELLYDFFREDPVSPRMLAKLANDVKKRKRASKKNKNTPNESMSW